MAEKYLAYPEYKDSGVEWLGEIPRDWELSKLRYMFSFGRGLTITKADLLDTGIPCVNYGEVHSKYGFEVDPEKHYLKCVDEWYLQSSPYALLTKGDLVFADTSEDIEGSGNFTQLVSDDLVFAGYHTVIARPFDHQCSRFYAYLMDSKEIRTQIRHMVKGVKVFSITQAILKGVEIWLPSLDERQTIANFLDFETAQIDTLIEKQQTLIQLLKEKRQAVISHAVTPNKDEKSSKLGYFIDLLSGYSFPSDGYKTEPEGNTALLRGINVGIGTLKWDETVWWSRTERDGLEAFELEEGDIVFGMDRPWISAGARVAEVIKSDLPCLLLQRVIRIRANKNTYQPFIKLCLASKEFKFSVEADLTGVSVPHISPDQVKSFPIRDIGYEQQKLITDDAFEKMKVLDLIEDSAEQAIQLMQERRTALISAAVTGKIDVRDWLAPRV